MTQDPRNTPGALDDYVWALNNAGRPLPGMQSGGPSTEEGVKAMIDPSGGEAPDDGGIFSSPQATRDAIIAPALGGIQGGLKGATPDENLDLLGVRSFPVEEHGGADVYAAANNRMFGYRGEYTKGKKIPVSMASSRIREALEAQANARAGGSVSAEDALAQTRLYYESKMAPLKERRTRALAQMIGELPARKIASLKDIDKMQGAVALGAAVRMALEGEDPMGILAAPVEAAQGRLDEDYERSMMNEKLRREALGMEYDSIDKELDDLRRSQLGEEGDIRRFEREDVKQREITERALEQQRRSQMFTIASGATKEDRQRMADAWELINDEKLPPEFRTQLDKEDWQERLGGLQADEKKETVKRLRATFDSYVDDAKYGAIGKKWDAKTKEVKFNEAAKGLEYLDREKALAIMLQRTRLAREKEEIKLLPKKFDLSRWKSIEDVRQGWARLSKDEQTSVRRQAAYDIAEYDAAQAELIAIEEVSTELDMQRARIEAGGNAGRLQQWDALHKEQMDRLEQREIELEAIVAKGRPIIPSIVAGIQEGPTQPPPDSAGKVP